MTQNPKSAPRPIDNLREEIDALDDALLDLVEKRLALSKSIAADTNHTSIQRATKGGHLGLPTASMDRKRQDS